MPRGVEVKKEKDYCFPLRNCLIQRLKGVDGEDGMCQRCRGTPTTEVSTAANKAATAAVGVVGRPMVFRTSTQKQCYLQCFGYFMMYRK